jgi:leucyl/phenylalanyl-tRNA--protein transferase
MTSPPLTPQRLLSAYAQGVFPMAMTRESTELHWFSPQHRGILPLKGLHLSRSLRKRLLRWDYQVRTDLAFAQVIEGCAERPETWINAELSDLYRALHHAGYAHSLEIWRGEVLLGGVFGVSLGGAFFGESMFSRERDASKLALVWLMDRLVRAGFVLFDTQFLTPHLQSMGGVEIPRAQYQALLARALDTRTDFHAPTPATPQLILQRMTQTS